MEKLTVDLTKKIYNSRGIPLKMEDPETRKGVPLTAEERLAIEATINGAPISGELKTRVARFFQTYENEQYSLKDKTVRDVIYDVMDSYSEAKGNDEYRNILAILRKIREGDVLTFDYLEQKKFFKEVLDKTLGSGLIKAQMDVYLNTDEDIFPVKKEEA